MGMSMLVRGSFEEKLRWTFSLYDLNGDGFVTRDELQDIVAAVHSMVGKYAEPPSNRCAVRQQSEYVFNVSFVLVFECVPMCVCVSVHTPMFAEFSSLSFSVLNDCVCCRVYPSFSLSLQLMLFVSLSLYFPEYLCLLSLYLS